MGRSGRRPERLTVLAKSLDVAEDYPGLHLSKAAGSSAAPEDAGVAEAALQKTRQTKFEAKKHVFRQTPSKSAFNIKEATKTLEDLINSGCSAGQASHLIRTGADVNYSRHKSTNLVKRVRRKDQEDVRSSLFTTAVARGSTDLISVLADRADQTNLDEALGIAISQHNIEAIKVLVVAGANPNAYEPEIRNAIRAKDVEMVCILCSGSRPLSDAIATRSLLDAVMSGELQVLRLLLWHGGNADSHAPSALLSAIHAERRDLVAALCLGKNPPGPAHLARAIASVCDDVEQVTPDTLSMVEILLAAGASGFEISQTIVEATKHGHRELVAKLVDYSDFDPERSPQAIKSSMSAGDLELFHSLISLSLEPVVVDHLLTFVPSIRQSVPYDKRIIMVESLLKNHGSSARAASQALLDASKYDELEMIDVLFKAGAKGDNIDEALYHAFKDHGSDGEKYNLIDALIRGGSDVNTHSGSCLMMAVSSRDIKALNFLLQGKPSVENLNMVFNSCIPVERSDCQFNILKLLLTAGASGNPVDRALLDVVDQSEEAVRFRQLFLDEGKANVNFQEGESICRVVKNESTALLRLLLKYGPEQKSLDNALRQAVQLPNRQKRLSICHLIAHCEPGISGSVLNQALISVVKLRTRDSDLVALLLDKGASIDHESAAALRIALRRGDSKLLGRLLNQKSEPNTILQMLTHALNVEDFEQRVIACQLLLATSTPLDLTSLGSMLHNTFSAKNDLRILELFLSKGASSDSVAQEAFNKAILQENKVALRLLVKAARESATLERAFKYIWTQKSIDLAMLEVIVENGICHESIPFSHFLMLAVQQKPVSRPLVEFLLRWNADVGYSHCQSVCYTASCLENDILALLLKHIRSRKAVSGVFETTMSCPRIWSDPQGAETARLLLEKGAFGESLDQNLLHCVDQFVSHRNSPQLLQHFITYGASSDYQNGLSFEIASRRGDLKLLQSLFETSPSPSTINNAFPYIFGSSRDEATILELVDLFVERARTSLDVNARHKELSPVLFLCIDRFPQSTKVLTKLLKYGAYVEQRNLVIVKDDLGLEPATPLLWALNLPATLISDDVSQKLILAGASLTYTTPHSKTNPMIAAVKQSRLSIVRMLLERSVSPSVPDHAQFTPLQHASRNEDLAIMQALIRAGAPPNDGSLHGAILECRPKAIELLLDSGHDPNFPSPLHNSKNALELIIREQSMTQNPPALIEMIKTLIAKGANKEYRYYEKSTLVIALDMPHATTITPLLLNAVMGEFVNEEFNRYRHKGYVYSPCSYLMHNKQASDPSQRDALLRALASYGCKPVYYREHGVQPDDYIGAPPEIERRERARREEAERQIEEDRQRKKRLAEEEEEHQLNLRRSQEAEFEKQRLAKQSHDMQMAQDTEKSKQQIELFRAEQMQRERTEERRRAAEIAHVDTVNQIRIENQREEHQLQLEYKEKIALQDQSVIDARANVERKLLEYSRQARREEEDAAERNHLRNLREIEAKRDGTREQSRLLDRQRKLIEYQIEANHKLAITDDFEPD